MVKITPMRPQKPQEAEGPGAEGLKQPEAGGAEVPEGERAETGAERAEMLRSLGAEMAGRQAQQHLRPGDSEDSRVQGAEEPSAGGAGGTRVEDGAEGLRDKEAESDEEDVDLRAEGLAAQTTGTLRRSVSPQRPASVPKLNIAAAVAIQAAEGDDDDDEDEAHSEASQGDRQQSETRERKEDALVAAAAEGKENTELQQTTGSEKTVVGSPAQPAPGLSISNMLMMLLSAYMIVAFAELYLVFRPKPCTSPDRKCLYPLFGEDELVDIYVHTSLASSPLGAKRNQIWNATNVKLQDASMRVVAPVQMPPQARVDATLYAQVTIVRSGFSPDLKDHSRFNGKDGRYRQVHPYKDALFFSTPITEKMIPIGSNSSMLLKGRKGPNAEPISNMTNSSQIKQWTTIDDHQVPQLVAVLLLAFSLLGLMRPTAGLACIRALLLIGIAVLGQPYIQWVVKKLHRAPVEQSKLALPTFSPPKQPMVHLKPQLRLRFVGDWNQYPENELPMSHLNWNARQKDLRPLHYSVHPMLDHENSWRFVQIAYEDAFGLQKKRLIPVAADGKGRPDPVIEIQFQTQGLHTFQAMRFLEGSFTMVQSHGLDERDLDDVKDLVSDQSLKVLGLTYLITFLHMIFDFLAFKNDIGFYRGRETYEGISTRSLLSNFVCSVIIFLYLLDNEYTSRIILGSTFISTLIEGWKAKRVSKARFVWAYLQPWVVSGRGAMGAGGKSVDTVAERRTDEIDAQGMRWLQRTLYPIVAGWALYSLITRPHKSWWSWAIHSLANGVYTFGFIAMTPQLFVNYKMKSVAHLPWRAFMYKAFNTFIDDVFSWIMTMPMSHRIACLRDDVVFFVYLYQRWLYPVDKSRPNEFGFVYEDPQEDGKDQGDDGESKKEK